MAWGGDAGSVTASVSPSILRSQSSSDSPPPSPPHRVLSKVIVDWQVIMIIECGGRKKFLCLTAYVGSIGGGGGNGLARER